jgi:hypothetical protein
MLRPVPAEVPSCRYPGSPPSRPASRGEAQQHTDLDTAIHGLHPPPWTSMCATSMPIKENRPHSTTAPPTRRRAHTFQSPTGCGRCGTARTRPVPRVPEPLAAQTSQVPFHRPSTGWRSGARTPVNARVRPYKASPPTEFRDSCAIRARPRASAPRSRNRRRRPPARARRRRAAPGLAAWSRA